MELKEISTLKHVKYVDIEIFLMCLVILVLICLVGTVVPVSGCLCY